MKIIEIEGNKYLNGTIRVSGAKNATVALIPAAILTDEEVTICNIPEITDTDALCDILKVLNVKSLEYLYPVPNLPEVSFIQTICILDVIIPKS